MNSFTLLIFENWPDFRLSLPSEASAKHVGGVNRPKYLDNGIDMPCMAHGFLAGVRALGDVVAEDPLGVLSASGSARTRMDLPDSLGLR